MDEKKNKINLTSKQITRWRYAVTILSVVIIIIFTWVIEVLEKERIELARRSNVLSELSAVRAKLEEALNTRLFLMRGVMAYVATKPDIDVPEFQKLASAIMENETGIRSIQLAKNTVVTHVYPLAGNEQAVGLRILELPLQRSAVERAIKSRTTVVAGPVNLVQGGVAFISRTPIFLKSSTGRAADSLYWGLATVLISRDSLFEEAGLFDSLSDIQVTIRGKDGLGEQGEVFFGDEELLQLQPVTLGVNLPNGSWQLMAIPTGGWDAGSTRIWWLRAGGIIIASFTGILIWFLISYQGRVQESEKRFRLITNNALDAIISMNEEGSITEWNLQAEKMFGWSLDQALRRKLVSTIIPTRFQEAHKRGVKQLMATDKEAIVDKRFEFYACHRDGHEFPVELSVIAIRAHDSYFFNASIRDITKRREKEILLIEKEEEYRTLFESAGDAIMIVKFSEKEAPSFVNFNNRTLEMFGCTREEMFNSTPESLSPKTQPDGKSSRKKIMENVNAVLEGEPQSVEWVHCRYDGTPFPVEVSLNRIKIGNENFIQAIVRDISSRKRAEEEKNELLNNLQQVQKMEAIGTLAGGIAHDFNNILTSIIGYADLNLRIFPPGTKTYADFKHILDSGFRARDLVKQILTFSRQEEHTLLTISISPIVKEALKFMRSSLPTNIEIRQNLDDQSSTIQGNITQIHQIIMNLCANAEHAMRPKGGVLEVNLKPVHLDASFCAAHSRLKEGDYLKLTVSDTGHGMSKATMDRIFDPFFTTKGVGEGTGMGLSTVHGIVLNHGGDIIVNSELGKGTNFDIYFPKSEDIEIKGKTKSLTIPRGNERILFVDDEESVAKIGQEMLESLGYEVLLKTNSLEALEVFKKDPQKFDLVITDQTMPNMTGDVLARKLMQIRPEIPVILCTGFSHAISSKKALSIGIREFIMKPYINRDIAQVIRKVLGQDKNK